MCHSEAESRELNVADILERLEYSKLMSEVMKKLAEIYTDEEIEAGIIYLKSVLKKSPIGTQRLSILAAEAVDRAAKELESAISEPKITS